MLLVFTFYSPLPFPLSHLHNWGFINRLATAMTFPSYRFIVTLLHFRNWYWCMENKFTDNFAFILRRGRIIIPAAFKISQGIFFIFLSISPSIMINIYLSIQMSNWPDTNALIAPAFEFIRVYFTRETVVTKPQNPPAFVCPRVLPCLTGQCIFWLMGFDRSIRVLTLVTNWCNYYFTKYKIRTP